MKKTIFTLSFLFLSATAPAKALISGYFGATTGSVSGNAKSESISTKNAVGGTAGAVFGVEANLLLIKLGVEGFVDKSFGFTSDTYKNPLFYGGKGKVMFNLIFVEPYIALGYGEEKANNSYSNKFGLAGAGVQAKLFGIGAFAEFNYLQSLKDSEAGFKTNRKALQVGLKYYFL